MTQEIIIHSEDSMAEFAHNFASSLKRGDVVVFKGGLGAGKSFVCRHIIQYLMQKKVNVISPTFNLLQIYERDDYSIYHYDLYRLKNFEEVFELGIEDALTNNICLIEWPEIIESILPKDTIYIDLEILSDTARKVSYMKLR